MTLLVILTVHLAIISLHASNATTRLPTLWNEAPSSISDYPVAYNPESRLINPWLYLDRLGLYKILIVTTTPLMPFCSSSNTSNIVFSLPSQFDSNRLFSNGTQQVSTDSPMWSAHLASIEHALPLIASKKPLLPSYNEQRFGISWANIVDFIGMSRKNTNLLETNKYQDEFFPQRTLRNDDQPPYCSDLSKTVNQGLELLFSIRTEWYPEMIKLWRPATCNYESRQDAQRVIETAAISKSQAATYYGEAVLKSYLFKCDQ